MIVHDLDVVRIAVSPHETKTPLIVDSDAVLPLSLAMQDLQTVAGGSRQVPQLGSAIQLAQLSAGNPFHGPKAATRLPSMESPGFRTTERPNHIYIV